MTKPVHREPETLLGRGSPPRKVAILKASRIGDFLCAVPALRALRRALPAAHLTLITLPMLHRLAQRLPWLDSVADFPGFPGLADQLFDARKAAAFFCRMQPARFDLAIQIQGSGVYANPFILMLGAKRAAGFIRAGDDPGLLHAALPLPEQGHEIDRMLTLPAFLGAAADDRTLELGLRPADRRQAAGLLAGFERPLVGIHASARDDRRRWPWERFARLARALAADFPVDFAVLGEVRDAASEALAAAIGPRAVNLAGKTGLPVLAAVIERLALLLTTDSGPAHMAYALQTPALVLYVEDLARYGPPPGGPHRVVGCRDPALGSGAQYARRAEDVSVAGALRMGSDLLARVIEGATGERISRVLPHPGHDAGRVGGEERA